MTTIKYIEKRFNANSRIRIRTANEIIGEYQAAGYTLTLRQLYYQFVSRGLLENTQKNYKSLGKLITDARLAGLISWKAIEDRTRSSNAFLINESERHTFYGIEYGFAMDMWSNQDFYVEAWIEKEALSNVMEKPCREFRVPYMACKGYLSASEAWRAGGRFEEAIARGQKPVLIHLGDHDPSGIDMTRDNDDRLSMFARTHDLDVRRIALNMDQVERYAPPPNPTKVTDSRSDSYLARFGEESWELDALEPAVIESLITSEIKTLVDPVRWNESLDIERERRRPLEAVYDHWPRVNQFLFDEDLVE